MRSSDPPGFDTALCLTMSLTFFSPFSAFCSVVVSEEVSGEVNGESRPARAGDQAKPMSICAPSRRLAVARIRNHASDRDKLPPRPRGTTHTVRLGARRREGEEQLPCPALQDEERRRAVVFLGQQL